MIEHEMLGEEDRDYIQREREAVELQGTEQTVRALAGQLGDMHLAYERASHQATLMEMTLKLCYERALKARDARLAAVLVAATEMATALTEHKQHALVPGAGLDADVARWRAAIADGAEAPPVSGERCCICNNPATGATSGGPQSQLRYPHCGGRTCRARVSDSIDALFGKRKAEAPAALAAPQAHAGELPEIPPLAWRGLAGEDLWSGDKHDSLHAHVEAARRGKGYDWRLWLSGTVETHAEGVRAVNALHARCQTAAEHGLAQLMRTIADDLRTGVTRGATENAEIRYRIASRIEHALAAFRPTVEQAITTAVDEAAAFVGHWTSDARQGVIQRAVAAARSVTLPATFDATRARVKAAAPDLWPDFEGDDFLARLLALHVAAELNVHFKDHDIHKLAACVGRVRDHLRTMHASNKPRVVLSVDWPSVWQAGPDGVEVAPVGRVLVSTWPSGAWHVEGCGINHVGATPEGPGSPRDRARAAAREYVLGLNGATAVQS